MQERPLPFRAPDRGPAPVGVSLLHRVAIDVGGEERPVTRPREQAVLARLALAAPTVVTLDSLVAAVWGDDPPARSVDAVRVHVSNLRRLIDDGEQSGRDILVTASAGYSLELPAEAVDVGALQRAVEAADLPTVRSLIGDWPGVDLGQYESGSGFFTAAAQAVTDIWLAGLELVVTAEVDAGRPGRSASRLEAALERVPLRESLWALLIRALAAEGRRAEALRAFQRARSALAEIGVEPGPSLTAAEHAALDRSIGIGAAPEPVARSGRSPPIHYDADYVDVSGSRIAYTTIGTGDIDLLLLHGGFVPFSVMPEAPALAAFLARLAGSYRVVLVDRRGIGASDPPADGGPVTLDHWVADCRAVLDAVGTRPTIAFGQEHAGPVAIALAAEQERIQGLVLHSTTAKGLRSADHPYGPSESAFDRITRMIDRLPGAGDMVRMAAPSAGDDQELRVWIERAGQLGASPRRAKELHRLYLDTDVRHLLAQVDVPATVLHPIRLVNGDPGRARYLADHLPDCELQLLDSGDHLFWLADADVVHAAINRVSERMASRAANQPVGRLRALVGLRLHRAASLLSQLGAEAVIANGDRAVGIFATLDAADRAATTTAQQHPDATMARRVADTTGTTNDPAIIDLLEHLDDPTR